MLKKTDRIHLKDAARMLEVSVMTIRRDLHQEDEPLPLTLLGGYIVMVHKPAPSMPVIRDVPKIIVMTYLLQFWLPEWLMKMI